MREWACFASSGHDALPISIKALRSREILWPGGGGGGGGDKKTGGKFASRRIEWSCDAERIMDACSIYGGGKRGERQLPCWKVKKKSSWEVHANPRI